MCKRAAGLLALERGKTRQAVAGPLGVSYVTVAAWREKDHTQGLWAREDAPRSGRPSELAGGQRATSTVLAGRAAPAGPARWSLGLLADKGIELGDGKQISPVQVDKILKKTC